MFKTLFLSSRITIQNAFDKINKMKEEEFNKINFTSLRDEEKEHLKKKITKTIGLLKRRKKRLRYSLGIAASISIIVTINIFYQNLESSSIQKYVKTTQGVDSKKFNKVKLILNDGNDIEIDGENSKIKYSNIGNQIQIGNSKTIKQSLLNNNKIVYNTLVVPYGRRSRIELSDGSIVWLNSGSKLVYPSRFIENNREVYLEGEAAFNVTHNKNRPFRVITDNQKIEVLGTVFNVSNYRDENNLSTVLKSGSVQIIYKGNSIFNFKKKLKITPGTLAVYNKGTNEMNSEKVETEKYFSWIEGKMIFHNDNLKFIMKKLARYYNVDIVINNVDVEKQTFSGALDLKESAEKVINIINETSNFDYSITNENKIIIN